MPDDACGDWRDSLAYAISSLKTDLKYDLMYEGEEIYTNADVVEMLEDLDMEIDELYSTDANHTVTTIRVIIRERIEALRGE